MGSESDLDIMMKASDFLKEVDVPHEVRILSAHRTPVALAEYIKNTTSRVFIAGAGMAAHLAGAVAAQTTLPVIGVPLTASPLNGMDSLLSTVQMPPGMPVATVAVNGAKNAAMLAAQILAIVDYELHLTLERIRTENSAKILEKSWVNI